MKTSFLAVVIAPVYTIFVLNLCSLYPQVRLILIWNEAIFSFIKGLNGQNHSKSLLRLPPLCKKISLLVKYMIRLPQQRDTHLLPLVTNWKALLYKVIVVGSLVPAMGNRTSCAQVHQLPQKNFDNKQDSTLFSWECFHENVFVECAETENKTRSNFVKNSYLALLYIYYHIIIIYIIDLLFIGPIDDASYSNPTHANFLLLLLKLLQWWIPYVSIHSATT